MIKVYAVALTLGVVGLVMVILGSALAENLGRPAKDPGARLGDRARMGLGALAGFGMGGMAAEYSPLGLGWQVSLAIALVAGVVSVFWVRYSLRRT
ncbi:MAG: hypothetical protein L0Z49_03225 [Actinobacteria bacterium]|nr:hypothetical protein [Actinomycetota bacterium]MCI0543443.1 hypothetical protein [Actinomycetota bacterium]MCI0677755.1 hypothetical protein [Actinomycetota bacterium]